MSEERKERCNTCRFWERDDGIADETEDLSHGEGGRCHRFPRVYHGNMTGDFKEMNSLNWTFPVVESDDWCGEWQGKDSRLKKTTPTSS